MEYTSKAFRKAFKVKALELKALVKKLMIIDNNWKQEI